MSKELLSSPNRGWQKRKWAVSKGDGPLIAAAEYVQKKLIQHYWPCTYEITHELGDHYALFIPKNAPGQSTDFERMLNLATRIVAAERRVSISSHLNHLYLHGEWHMARRPDGRYSGFKPGPQPQEDLSDDLPY